MGPHLVVTSTVDQDLKPVLQLYRDSVGLGGFLDSWVVYGTQTKTKTTNKCLGIIYPLVMSKYWFTLVQSGFIEMIMG